MLLLTICFILISCTLSDEWYDVTYSSSLSLWLDLPPNSRTDMLSTNYLVSSTRTSPFLISLFNTTSYEVTVTSQGFVYLNSYTAVPHVGGSGYISPLMANFIPDASANSREANSPGIPEKSTADKTSDNPEITDSSNPDIMPASKSSGTRSRSDSGLKGARSVLIHSTRTVFTAEWRNMKLSECEGTFTFQCQVHADGRIVMLYRDIPCSVSLLSQSTHPVEVGIRAARPPSQLGNLPETLHSLDLHTKRIISGTTVVITPKEQDDTSDQSEELEDTFNQSEDRRGGEKNQKDKKEHETGDNTADLLVVLVVILAVTIPMLLFSMFLFYKIFLAEENQFKEKDVLPF